MAINLDIIRGLDSNKMYYRSSTTGEIKEAGFWQKFKSMFGVKSALLKATNLVESVRASLLRKLEPSPTKPSTSTSGAQSPRMVR